jgi:hypothetical protein
MLRMVSGIGPRATNAATRHGIGGRTGGGGRGRGQVVRASDQLPAVCAAWWSVIGCNCGARPKLRCNGTEDLVAAYKGDST